MFQVDNNRQRVKHISPAGKTYVRLCDIINDEIKTLDELNMPEVLKKTCHGASWTGIGNWTYR